MGAVASTASDTAGKRQHVDLHRKLGLRRRLGTLAMPGAAYVPFIGDGDIAAAVWADRDIWGADLDPARVQVARAVLPNAQVVTADCDTWPFGQAKTPPFAVADFDAWSYPYDAFRAWWANSERTERCVVCFTDGQPQAINRTARLHRPSGHKEKLANSRLTYNTYWSKIVAPWLAEAIGPDWRVVHTEKYLRRGAMLYWGAVITAGAETLGVATQLDRASLVEDALFEAAQSGNVGAILAWQDRHPLYSPAERIAHALELFD